MSQNGNKVCQSCIERGYSNPQPAEREWQTGIYYCNDCFNAVIGNMLNIPQNSMLPKNHEYKPGPILEQVYELLSVPKELQFDRVDTVCKHRNEIFLHHMPTNVNKPLTQLVEEMEQMKVIAFQFQYKMESLEQYISKLKQDERKSRLPAEYDDAKEAYSKVKKPAVAKANAEARVKKQLAATLGMQNIDLAEMTRQAQALQKKKKEREFNIIAGNCPACGKVKPCKEHPNEPDTL